MPGCEDPQAPELCKRLSALYTFMYTSLVEACGTRDIELVDEVIQLLRFDRETLVMCLDEMTREKHSAAGMAAIASVNPTRAQGSDRPHISISS